MDLCLQLKTISKDTSTAKEYILRLKNMASYLGTISETVSGRDLILYGLGGLDSTYNYFVFFLYENKIYEF